MAYLVPTQYFLIQLQLINHFFNSLTNEKGVSNKKSVTMHSSIIIFECFIHFQSWSFSPCGCLGPFFNHCRKGPFSPAMVAGFTSSGLQIGTNLFILLCWGNSWKFFMLSTMSSSSICFKKSLALWRFKNLDKKKTPWFVRIYYITWLVKTQKSKTKCSFVKIVVLKLAMVIWDRNGPIINLDASARSASLILLFRPFQILLRKS